ncbi:MAG: V-type ATPase subunit [Verrucomicrobiales bacterium]|nr:V-type ATPase subunit [Verrucomicrobiales bacterium]
MATNDLDYLATRLHARRSRMAEAERLDALCRIRDILGLGRALRPEFNFQTAVNFQRVLLQDLVQEFSFCLRHLAGAEHALVRWMQARFQLENIKVLLRGFLNHTPLDTLQEHLVPLPRELALDPQALLNAETLDVFVKHLPAGWPRKQLQEAIAAHLDEPHGFFFEAALDGGYFRELLARIGSLPDAEAELIEPLARQEVELFHLMLAVRGKFNHGLTAESLLPLRVPGSGAAVERFKAMLAATDIAAAAKLGLGHACDELPATRATSETAPALDPAILEALGWRRFLRLANGAFRRSHMGLAAVVGYLEIRRVEVANLITLSEGIRTGVEAGEIRARMIPRTNLEGIYV